MMRIEHRMRQERAGALAMRRNAAETGGDDFRIQGFYAQTVTFAQQNVEQLGNVRAGFHFVDTNADIAIR